MFPGRLPGLPDLHSVSDKATLSQLFTIGGGSGGFGFPGGGGIGLGLPPIFGGGSGGSGGGVTVTPVGIGGAIAGGLSSVLGIPAINWGRIAAFLLGLLLVAGGIYLIKPVQQVVNRTIKTSAKGAAEGVEV